MHEKESMSLKMQEATHQGEWAASGMTTGSKETGSLFPQAHRAEFCQRDWACVHFSKCLVTHTHVHKHTYTHTRTHTYNLYTHICTHTYTHSKIFTHIIHTCTHIHTHTHTHKSSLYPLRTSEKTTFSSSHQINVSGSQATVCHQSRMSFKGSLQLGSLPWGPSADPHVLSEAPESLHSEGCVVHGAGIEIPDSGPEIW